MRKPKKLKPQRPVKARLPAVKAKITYDLTDKAERERFYDAFEKGLGSESYVIERLKLSRATYYRRKKSDPVFNQAVNEMLSETRPKIVDKIIELAQKGDRYLLMQLARAFFPEFRPGSLVNVNLPPGGGDRELPVSPHLVEFMLTEDGNRLAHAWLLGYLEWCESKGINPVIGRDATEERPSPAQPLPKNGDAEKLEHRKGLKLIEDKDDED